MPPNYTRIPKVKSEFIKQVLPTGSQGPPKGEAKAKSVQLPPQWSAGGVALALLLGTPSKTNARSIFCVNRMSLLFVGLLQNIFLVRIYALIFLDLGYDSNLFTKNILYIYLKTVNNCLRSQSIFFFFVYKFE